MSFCQRHSTLSTLAFVALLANGSACKDDKGSPPADGGGSNDAATTADVPRETSTGTPDVAPADSGGGTPDTNRPDTGGDAGASDGGADAAPAFAPVACTGVTDKKTAITVATGRNVYCAIDLGSNNAKLQVLSMEPGKPLSFKDERQCRTRLGFGAKVFDSATMTKKPLPTGDIANLITVMKEFQEICTLDKGRLVGTEATQWARDATNITEVKAMVKAGTTLDIEVLTPEQEGIYGYAAGTRNAPDKLSLDPGSNSFQIGWWDRTANAARTVSVPFGYVRGAAKHYPEVTADTYDAARAKHATDLTTQLNTALGALTPATNIAAIKALVTAGTLKPEIHVVGQDGALHLSVKALLRGADGKWIDTKTAYDARVAQEKPTAHPMFGDVTTVLLPADFNGFFTTIVKPVDFTTLRTMPVRELYGEKSLANAVLLDTLIKELGITTVVLVPQEMPAGYILAKVAAMP